MNVVKSIGRPDREQGKNTNCGAGFHFRLENVVGNKSMREEREKYPLWVKIQLDNNDSLNHAEYFKFLSVSDETAQYYTELFSHCDCGAVHAQVYQTMPQSGDIVMIDTTSNLERNDSKLFHIVCPSPIGALPLGDMIVTSSVCI